MQHIGRLILLPFLLFCFLPACVNRSKDAEQQDPSSQTVGGYFIEWQDNTCVCVAESGTYPRMRRLNDNSLMVAYENAGSVLVKKSADEGATWNESSLAYEWFNYTDEQTGGSAKVEIANPEIIQLNNGDILLACNLRPQTEGVYPYSIALKRSVDDGVTWSDPDILYQAGTNFGDGCWEPSFLMLPGGELHIYFANESPYRDSSEQEISMLCSSDNGVSWSEIHTTVSFREGKRDGMPVAVHDGEEIYVAIEDNVSGQFKPWVVHSPIEQAWATPGVLHDSPYRYSALKNAPEDDVYAGAPYLILTDEGIFVLSYQTTESRRSDWQLSTMEVVVSDSPSDFRNPSQPFDVPLTKQAKWNALCDLGDNTVAALSATNFNSDNVGVWMIKGKISKQ